MKKSILTLLFFAIVIFAPVVQAAKGYLIVNFIDVGQGDCILIQTPNGNNILIDCGPEKAYPVIRRYLENKGIYKFRVAIMTCRNIEHFYNINSILHDYTIEKLYMGTGCFLDWLKHSIKSSMHPDISRVGKPLILDPDLNGEFLAPTYGHSSGYNYSVITKVVYGEKTFLFTSDSDTTVEQDLMEKNKNIKADVLQIPNHGLSGSISKEFLEAVSPSVVVISCGNNVDSNALDLETMRNITTLRTNKMGTVTLFCDGRRIWMK